MSKPETATVEEVANRLGLCTDTTYTAIHRGEIPATRVGRQYLIPRAWLDRVVSDPGALPAAEPVSGP